MSDYGDSDIMYDSESDEEGYDSDDGLQFSGAEEDTALGEQLKRRNTEYQTLTPDEISTKMFTIIDEVNAVFQVCTSLKTDETTI